MGTAAQVKIGPSSGKESPIDASVRIVPHAVEITIGHVRAALFKADGCDVSFEAKIVVRSENQCAAARLEGQTGQEISQVVVPIDPAAIGKAHLTDNSLSVASDAAQMAEPISQDSETGLGFNTKF